MKLHCTFPLQKYGKNCSHCSALSLCRCVHLSGSGHHLSQRSLHSDGHNFRLGWDCGIPHSVGRDPCSALTPHVCYKCHLRSGLETVIDTQQFRNAFLWHGILIFFFWCSFCFLCQVWQQLGVWCLWVEVLHPPACLRVLLLLLPLFLPSTLLVWHSTHKYNYGEQDYLLT